MTVPRRPTTDEDYKDLLSKFDTWLFDCDGVLWRGSTPIDGAIEALQLLRSQNKKIIFVTNNASLSRKSYIKKLNSLGIEAYIDEIFGSAYASAVYLSSVIKFPKDKKVFVIGMAGIEEELCDEGISSVGGTDPSVNTLEPLPTAPLTPDPDVGAVLCGFDTSINYTKLSKAFIHLHSNPSCLFLATNSDTTFPGPGGMLLPGAGAIYAPLCASLGRKPTSIGKPAQTMLDCIKAKHHFDSGRAIMVGDRLNTDIEFGKQGGLSTLLVLTGVSHEADILPERSPPTMPDYVIASIGNLIQINRN